MNRHRPTPARGADIRHRDRSNGRRRLASRRARLGLVGLLGALAVLALGVVGAFAVHDVGFQLEGNADATDKTYVDIDDTCPGNPVCTVTTPGTLSGALGGPYDWDSLFTTDANGFGTERSSLPSGFEKADFVVDFGASGTTFLTGDDTTFATGSKDTLPINLASGSDWQCNHDNNVNSKIDIINAYAANYVAGGHKYIYFGLEKDVDNGSNDVGLWLFQDRNVGCSAPVGSADFTGHHTNGDLLLVSEFSNGGGVSEINAYEWIGDDATGHLNTTAIATSKDCLDQFGGDALCAVINGKTITMPWKTADSSVVNAAKVSPNFFEGGIDLTQFPEFADRCFAGFMLDTRSSPSLTATLFDYAAGSIDTCDARISVTPNGLNEVNTAHTFTVTVEKKTGATFVPAVGATVTSSLAAGSTGSITGGTCTTTVTNASGQCTVIVNSSTAGTATLLVSSDIDVQGSILTRDNIASTTAPQGPGATNNNVKTWVDGNIAITPSATNQVGVEHTFTITANALGSVVPTSVAITPSVSPAPSSSSDTCASPTLSNGGKTATCTVTINSNVTGVFTANGTAVFTFTNGPTVTRDTDPTTATIGSGPNGSGPATKT
ncbi:MAG TPA: hypothetical protein VK194_06775, partial [Candidatus Deferrimicrobium sp.]|nr:hypothetical protein [Candidatus Deferrimicrobium sp.]